MRNAVVAWLVSVLVAGFFVNVSVLGVIAAEPGKSINGLLVEQWHRQLEEGGTWEFHMTPSAGLVRETSTCNLDIVTGSDETLGVWRSMKAVDGTDNWLKYSDGDRAASSVAVVDVNDDGVEEVVGSTLGGTLEVLKATSGEFVWTFPNPPAAYLRWGRASPAVADIMPLVSGLEIVSLHSPTSTVYAFQGVPDFEQNNIWLHDYIDGDLSYWKDLYYGGQMGQEPYAWDLLWFADLRKLGGDVDPNEITFEYSSPAIADVDADGDLDVVVGSRNGYVYLIDGQDGDVLSAFPSGKVTASVAVANVNEDPYQEIFIGDSPASGGQTAFRALRWNPARTPPGLEYLWPPHTEPEGRYLSSPAVGDIDGDVELEVVVGYSGYPSEVQAFDAKSGSLEWSAQLDEEEYTSSSPALAARSNVNRWEMTWPFFRGNVQRTGFLPSSGEEMAVYIGTWGTNHRPDNFDSSVYVLDGSDGSPIDRFYVDITDDVYASPVVGDIDGDYRLEVNVLSSLFAMGPMGGGSEGDPPPPDSYPAFWSIEDTGSSGSGTTSCGEPVADFGWWPLKPLEGQEIRFTDLSYDTAGEIVNWRWDFHHPGYPDGGPSVFSVQNPTHIYGDNGFFEITLTVWDDDNHSASVTKTVEVINANPTINAWNSTLAGSEQRTHGYWKHQCWMEENNTQSEEHPGISPFVDFIREHSLVWTDTTWEEICVDLRFAGNEQPQKLKKQLIAVWLNVASGKLFLDTPLIHYRTPSDTIGEFLFEAEDAILRGLTGEYGRLHQIAVDINEDAGLFRFVPPVSGFYTASVTDPGSDDLTFDWDCTDGSSIPSSTHFNNGIGTDPYPSPDGIFPFTVEDSVTCKFPFPPSTFRPSLTVTDDDLGQAKDEDIVDMWSADYRFVYAMDWIDIGYGFVVADITVTYLDWDSCVVPIDPFTGEPLFGGESRREGGEGKSGGDGISGSGGTGEESGP